MTTENQLNKLERDAKALKAQIDLGTALDKLRSNRDFNKVIAEGYLKDEAIRLVHLKGDPAVQSPASQASIIRDIDAIGSLASFFALIQRNTDIAKKQLADLDEERTYLMEGGE